MTMTFDLEGVTPTGSIIRHYQVVEPMQIATAKLLAGATIDFNPVSRQFTLRGKLENDPWAEQEDQ